MITADTISDADIERLFESLPRGHYAVQWCIDARSPSLSHPHRQRNARARCAELINARRAPCGPDLLCVEGSHEAQCPRKESK